MSRKCHQMSPKCHQNVTRCHQMSRGVTRCHEVSRGVTECHGVSRRFLNVTKCLRAVTKCHLSVTKMSRNVTECLKMSRNVTICHQNVTDMWSGPVLGGTLLLDSDITPEHRLLQCVRPSLSNLEHYSGRNVGAVMFQVRQQKSKGLAQAVFRKKTSGNHLGLDQTYPLCGRAHRARHTDANVRATP